jgi:hypothetical protein
MAFGTMDRKHSVAAGLVGFRMPEAAADRTQYTKVHQVKWTLDLAAKSWHLGGHMGWTTTRFARDFLGPILLGQRDPGRPMAVLKPSAATAGAVGPAARSSE